MRLVFVVPGPPVASERVQKVPILKRDGKLGLRAFTPPKSAEYLERVQRFAASALQRTPSWKPMRESSDALRVQLHFVRPDWRGDIDNLEKSVLDGMQKAGVFQNDNRIVQSLVSIHTARDADHRVEVIVEPATPLRGPLWKTIALANGWVPKGVTECANNKQ